MLGRVEKIQIKKSKPLRSYGFILGYDGERYYFPLRGREELQEGIEVSFRGSRDEKGNTAHDIQTIV